jgi:hypothetical protein
MSRGAGDGDVIQQHECELPSVSGLLLDRPDQSIPVLPYWSRQLADALAGITTGNSAVDQQRQRRRAQLHTRLRIDAFLSPSNLSIIRRSEAKFCPLPRGGGSGRPNCESSFCEQQHGPSILNIHLQAARPELRHELTVWLNGASEGPRDRDPA